MTTYTSLRHICTIDTMGQNKTYINATYEFDTCVNTLLSVHIYCPACGDIWARRMVFAVDLSGIAPPKKLHYTAQAKACASCGDGSLFGVAPFPADTDPQYKWWYLTSSEEIIQREIDLELCKWNQENE